MNLFQMPLIRFTRAIITAMVLSVMLGLPAQADHIMRFIGSYTGSADIVSADGSTSHRDMSVTISETKKGFQVDWTTTTFKPDGRTKEKAYSIDFVSTDRHNIYSAAMERDVFGHEVQLDPMKGEPFVWGRIVDDTLTVFSLFVDDDGGYEMQQYDRTLADGGLMLEFSFLQNGQHQRTVSTFLKRQ